MIKTKKSMTESDVCWQWHTFKQLAIDYMLWEIGLILKYTCISYRAQCIYIRRLTLFFFNKPIIVHQGNGPLKNFFYDSEQPQSSI